MSETTGIFLLAIGITAFTAYVFELVLPLAERHARIEKECKEAGGMIYEQKNSPDICIKKEIIIIK